MTGYDPRPALDDLWRAIDALPDPLVTLALRGGAFDPDRIDTDELDPVSRDVHALLAPVYRELLQLVRLSDLRRKAEVRDLNRAVSGPTQPWTAGDVSGDPDAVVIDPDPLEPEDTGGIVDDNEDPPNT